MSLSEEDEDDAPQRLKERVALGIEARNRATCFPGEKPFIKVKLMPIASAPLLKNNEIHVSEHHKLFKLVKYLRKELKADFKIHCNQFVPSPDTTFADLARVGLLLILLRISRWLRASSISSTTNRKPGGEDFLL